jgi:hypothetical protein
MTDNENASDEAQDKPVPNPYNMNKSWHTADVMPTGNVENADSLFVAPQPAKQEEGDQQEEQPVAKKSKPYKQPNYKKRYDDLKKHYDSKLNEWSTREQQLIQSNMPEYKAPKTIAELEQFKAKYPDIYGVVETVSHLQSEAKTQELEATVQALQQRESVALREKAEIELLNKHPDFAAIRNSDEFHEWVDTQPEDIQAWVYNNPHNVGLASRAIDLFKQDIGLTQPQKKQTRKKSKSSSSKAADMVSTKTTKVESTGQPKIWTQQEIEALPMDEYDRLEAEIDKALEEGRVRL